MIRIPLHPQPRNFEAKVRAPGRRFLARTPHPRPHEWQKHNYWSFIHGDLVELYSGICAYCASWMPADASNHQMRSSVDHFIPKTKSPPDAYEWQNLRICRRRMNQNKGEEMILDPVTIVNGSFQLDFDTFLISADRRLKRHDQDRIEGTIDQLDLNHADYVGERTDVIHQYCLNEIDFRKVERRFPFIATEMQRVSFDRTRKTRMRERFERLRTFGVRIAIEE
jgi:hypothetical protein